MKVVDAIAQILKAEGVEYLFAYPVNPLIESAEQARARIAVARPRRDRFGDFWRF